ncbi:hypothetical protein ACOMHN_004877 [Nucella lapillus]
MLCSTYIIPLLARKLDLKGNCSGANSGFCKDGTYCDWLEQCKPRAGRFGGGCEVEGSKCEVAHSVCQDSVCACADGSIPDRNFQCEGAAAAKMESEFDKVSVIISLMVVALCCGLVGLVLVLIARRRSRRKQQGDL